MTIHILKGIDKMLNMIVKTTSHKRMVLDVVLLRFYCKNGQFVHVIVILELFLEIVS